MLIISMKRDKHFDMLNYLFYVLISIANHDIKQIITQDFWYINTNCNTKQSSYQNFNHLSKNI